jgi:hypothetical protein
MSKTLTEALYFFVFAGASALFNRALFSERIGTWGHVINYAIIVGFFMLAAVLGLAKLRKIDPSKNRSVALCALLGWLVAASWMAKFHQ